ncbi:MAG TPA: hypothetical protein VJ623_01390 [Holophagaceae bacterium]|nr:hypothetical protein [Holophagaceae bacterium]
MAYKVREGRFWIVETRWSRYCLPGTEMDPDGIFETIPDILELNLESGWFLELPTLCPNGAPAWTGPFRTAGEAFLAGAELGAPTPTDAAENPFLRQLRVLFGHAQVADGGAGSPASEEREQSR